MKKLLGISLVAMMAVTSANAEIASKGYVDQQTGQLSTLTTTAKNNLVGAINELAGKAGNASVADQIANALTEYTKTGLDESYAPANVLQSLNYASTGDGVVTAVNQTNGAVSATKAKITNTEIADNAAIAQSKIDGLTTALNAKANTADLGTAAAANVAESIAENGEGLATAGQVYTAVANAQTASVANLDMAQVGGNGNVVLTVAQADGQVSATAGKITNANVDDNAAIAQSKIDGLTTALNAKANTADLGALATKDTVATADIDANAVTSTQIANDAVTLSKITSTLPTSCQGSGAECVLKSSNGAVAWEVIQRATGETPNNTTGSNAN